VQAAVFAIGAFAGVRRSPYSVVFAKLIRPRLQAPKDSHEWATAKRGEIFGRAGTAIMNAIQTHVAEKDAEK